MRFEVIVGVHPAFNDFIRVRACPIDVASVNPEEFALLHAAVSIEIVGHPEVRHVVDNEASGTTIN